MATQTDGNPLLAIHLKAVDGRVIDLVGLGLANGAQQARNLLGSIVFLGDNELHGRLLTYMCIAAHGRGCHSCTQRTTSEPPARIIHVLT